MGRPVPFAAVALALAVAGCNGAPVPKQAASAVRGPITIALDLQVPSRSEGVWVNGHQRTTFQVGYGRHGVTCAGTRFEEGYTPLGRFRVNAILSNDQFVMHPSLIKQSGKNAAELKAILFRNMNAIDFSGDGEIGEYGIGYISLEPINSVRQPFKFNTYDGKFRWYSFAIHGSNNESRVGEKATGGCLNLREPVLKKLLGAVKLGDEVVVTANGPCTP
ncbi:MAG: L,D-transpeptidase [Synechococcus sp.]|nr:L,D-transpeptidase [Synechococcus sp.]